MALSVPIPEKFWSLLAEKVAPVIKLETQKILSIPELVESIKDEMDIAKEFLKKTEEKADKANDRIKKRVRELRELVFKIEDALDEYKISEHHQSSYQTQHNNNSGCIIGIREFLHGSSTAVMGFKSRHEIACKIVRIKKAMEKIKGNEKSYEESIFNHIEEDSNADDDDDIEDQRERGKNVNYPGFYPLYKDEEELVGFNHCKEELIRKLDLEKKKYSKGQFVLAMWGLPGVGKTTLARKVYEDEHVRKFFSCHAWITTTRPYKRVDLLKCLFRQFILNSVAVASGESMDSISVQDVQKLQDNEVVITDRLRSYLKKNHPQNRYLVVLDDVSQKSQLSKIIKAALVPSHSEGGRMLLTTRSEGIANYWKTSSSHGETYYLPTLSEKHARVLFSKYAFGGEMNCPWKLQSLRDTIVNECDGLPFLIEKVGAVFSTTQKWIELYQDFQINPLTPKAKKCLLSSYHEMPCHLKPCFLYLCMFPKGYKLERMRIVRLWIAEGFVKGKEHNTPEEAAEEYLNELVERGMVHLLENDDTGRQRVFRLPYMWRHIMLPKLADLSFCHVFPQKKFNIKNPCRRLSIHDDLQNTVISPSVRSVLSFVHPERFPISWSLPFQEAYFRLKVLDLQNSKFTEIPRIMGNLHNLRYLSLRNTGVKELPASISGLWNLQTLDLKHAPVRRLPEEINCLHKLRHLIVSHCEQGTEKRIPVIIAKGVLKNLTELQKLAFLEGSANGIASELIMLTQLRRLAIVNLKHGDAENFCKALESMKKLRSLLISTISNEVIDLNHIDSPPEFLERLYLEGPLKGSRLPKWIDKLEHLVRVRLINSGFIGDPLENIRKMEDLLVLELYNTHQSKVLNFGYSAFKKLRVLRIENLRGLKHITAGTNSLPQLEKAECQHCPLLEENSIPPQIRKVLKRKSVLAILQEEMCEVGDSSNSPPKWREINSDKDQRVGKMCCDENNYMITKPCRFTCSWKY